jgi:hypothetical protein
MKELASPLGGVLNTAPVLRVFLKKMQRAREPCDYSGMR